MSTTLGTLLVALITAAVVGGILFALLRGRKRGSGGCGGSCSACGSCGGCSACGGCTPRKKAE